MRLPGRDERGATSVIQLVLIFPALLMMLMSIIQFGLLAHARNVAEQAAQEGAATARRFDGTEAEAKADALTYLTLLGPQTLQDRGVTVNRGSQSATVTITGTVISLVPGVNLSVSESSTGPVERYVPPVVQP